MAKVTVLFLTDKLVGPHMELLRNVCDPSSLSKPHVTVRYSDDVASPATDFDIPVKHIDLVEACAFGLDDHAVRSRFTVYVRAASERLEFLHYKQNYPDSEFHITAYNGPSRAFAERLLVLLRKFDWNLRVSLPRGTRLTEIPVRAERIRQAKVPREFDPKVRPLFRSITGLDLNWPFVRDMTDDFRLELAERICQHLMKELGRDYRRAQHRNQSETLTPTSSVSENESESEIFVTPPELARDISKLALRYHKRAISVDFGDPAVGTGAFFAALLETIGPKPIASAIGIDINSSNLEIARRKWSHKGLKVKVADFLHLDELSPRTLILANPPYLRQQRIDSEYKWKLRERASVKTQMVVSGLAGIYVYFLLLSDSWMAEGCVAAWLIPSEFMQTDYGEAIRRYLTEKVELLRIHRFDLKPRFEAVHVFPAVVIFRKSHKRNQTVTITAGEKLLLPEFEQHVTIDDLHKSEKWRIPFSPRSDENSSKLRIKDLFDIRRGIATGANDFFILDREYATSLGLPNEVLKPILPKARYLKHEIIDGKSGWPDVEPQLCVIDTDLSITEISDRFPLFADYLSKADELGIRERTLVKKRRPWYKQENRSPAPFLCTYMGRQKREGPPLRFFLNRSNAIATNTYLMLYPKTPLREALDVKAERISELFQLLKNSAVTTMQEQWRMHAGGLHKIEPRELGQVRLLGEPKWLSEIANLRIR